MNDMELRQWCILIAQNSAGDVELIKFADRVRCFVENEEMEDDGGGLESKVVSIK